MHSTEMQKSVSVQVDSDFALLLPSGAYEIKKMEPRSRLRKVILFCLLLSLFGMVAFGYFCPDQVCALSPRERVSESLALSYAEAPGRPLPDVISQPGLSYDEVLHDDFRFDLDAHDVMVFLHIQKTGGTSFGRHLVMDLDLKRPCNCQRARKRCHCFRPHSNEIWLFSRYSTGWKCGLHADFTELTACVGGELDRHEGSAVHRRYFYITLLREPVARYLSEYRHVKRGATWKGSRHWCQGRTASAAEVPACYTGESWRGVTLEEFASCSWNLANNRQTRMLADLALVGCYNGTLRHRTPDIDRVLLASAKRNLAAMAYFGLTEFQRISQYVFEETFNLRFAVPFTQHNATVSGATLAALSPTQVAHIKRLNSLDLELYDFAKNLMFKRCGLHADFTELTACVGGELDRHEGSAVHRRYFYITLLREPVARYLSEYRHVKRGATWKGSRHWCQGRTASAAEVPACYTGESWRGVTLEEFASCSWNLANNRQTRMLADLALVGCYNGTLRHRTPDIDRVLLASAKRNLAAMAYFGLTEFQRISQYVFEETFNLRFAVPFTQHNATVSGATLAALSPTQVAHIKRLNSLDLELYDFAKNLMFKRFEALKKRDSDFEFRWRHLGEVARSGVTEFDWDSNLEDATTEKDKGKTIKSKKV